MPRCTRKGCGKEFEADQAADVCTFHPGAPVFHEGLKSWSCCQEFNKPVMEFDEFMKIPGCTETDAHSSAAPEPQAPVETDATKANISSSRKSDGKEVFSFGGAGRTSATPKNAVLDASLANGPAPVVEDEDDLSIPVAACTTCRRKGCGVSFVSDEVNRIGDGEGTVCIYHPLAPIFREGSKGYLCCKPRVLEFDEFLKIKGCKTGRHCFVPKKKDVKVDELVECRIDHYQTLEKVQVSVFAKKVDKEKSTVQFESDEIKLDLLLPDSKRFTRIVKLFGPIDPSRSSFSILGTKVELSLQKTDNRSWTVLEKTDRDLGGVSLTFGVSGRTGTVGGKEIILDESNKVRPGP